jgi:hypothetical protein
MAPEESRRRQDSRGEVGERRRACAAAQTLCPGYSVTPATPTQPTSSPHPIHVIALPSQTPYTTSCTPCAPCPAFSFFPLTTQLQARLKYPCPCLSWMHLPSSLPPLPCEQFSTTSALPPLCRPIALIHVHSLAQVPSNLQTNILHVCLAPTAAYRTDTRTSTKIHTQRVVLLGESLKSDTAPLRLIHTHATTPRP